MPTEPIPLQFTRPGMVRLRELTGHAERAVTGTDSMEAMKLLDALLENRSKSERGPLRAADLVVADRDRVLAKVYAQAFGDQIEGMLTCSGCGRAFDLQFSLQHIMQSLDEWAAGVTWTVVGEGSVEDAKGLRVRLPTGHDELAVAGLDSAEAASQLFSRCTKESHRGEDREACEEWLEQVAPLLDLPLTAPCPECGHGHSVRFNVQQYLLSALVGERQRLLTEIHRIATAYGWPLDQILSLTRSERRRFVELIEQEKPRKGRAMR